MDDITVSNLALSRIGQDPIVTSIDPTDGSVESALCSDFLPVVKERIFSSYAWSFLRVKDKLAQVMSEPPHPPYEYLYAFPSDARIINFVFAAKQPEHSIPYSIESNRKGQRFICCDFEDAWCEYQMFGDELTTMPALIEDAITWALAAELAGAIIKGTTGAKMAQEALQMSELMMQREQNADARQERSYVDNKFVSEFERSRWL